MSVGPLGMNSSMDINTIVNKIVEAERAPKQQRIDQERESNNTNISAYGRLRESLDSMKDLMVNFRQEKAFSARKVETSDEAVVSATASVDAMAGQYSVNVRQLAQNHKLASHVLSERVRFGAGTLNIEQGNRHFSVDIKDKSKLEEVVSGINSAPDNTGVRAAVIHDVDGLRLVLSATQSGKASMMQIQVDADSSSNPLTQLAYQSVSNQELPVQMPASSQSMIEVQAAQDAQVVLDGVAELSSQTNVIENAIDGVNLTLKSVSAADQAAPEISIEYDRDRIRDSIQQLVNSYNQFHQVAEELSGGNSGTPGLLSGDSIVRSAESKLKTVVSAQIEQAPEGVKSLTELGITTTRQGTLEIDQDVLNKKLNNNFNELAMFFGGNNGFARKMEEAIQSMTGVTGSISNREKTLTERNYRLQDDQAVLDRRMASLEQRTHAKFEAMKDATDKMQSQLAGMMNSLS